MTPYRIEILLHFYCSNAPFARCNAPIFSDTIRELEEVGLLTVQEEMIQITRRGMAYVKMLCLMPYPTEQWVVTGNPGLSVTLDAEERARAA